MTNLMHQDRLQRIVTKHVSVAENAIQRFDMDLVRCRAVFVPFIEMKDRDGRRVIPLKWLYEAAGLTASPAEDFLDLKIKNFTRRPRVVRFAAFLMAYVLDCLKGLEEFKGLYAKVEKLRDELTVKLYDHYLKFRINTGTEIVGGSFTTGSPIVPSGATRAMGLGSNPSSVGLGSSSSGTSAGTTCTCGGWAGPGIGILGLGGSIGLGGKSSGSTSRWEGNQCSKYESIYPSARW